MRAPVLLPSLAEPSFVSTSPYPPMALPPAEPPAKTVCYECAMRDQELAHIDVLSPEIWERDSDAEFDERLRIEEQEQGQEQPDAFSSSSSHSSSLSLRPRALPRIGRGDPLTDSNVKEWLAHCPPSGGHRYRTLQSFVVEQRSICFAHAYLDYTPRPLASSADSDEPSAPPARDRAWSALPPASSSLDLPSANLEKQHRSSRIHAALPPLPPSESSPHPPPPPPPPPPPSGDRPLVAQARRFSSPIMPRLLRKNISTPSEYDLGPSSDPQYIASVDNLSRSSPMYNSGDMPPMSVQDSNSGYTQVPPRRSSAALLGSVPTSDSPASPSNFSTRPHSTAFWGQPSAGLVRPSPSASALSLAPSGSVIDMHLVLDRETHPARSSRLLNNPVPYGDPYENALEEGWAGQRESGRRSSSHSPNDTSKKRKSGKGIKGLLSKLNLNRGSAHGNDSSYNLDGPGDSSSVSPTAFRNESRLFPENVPHRNDAHDDADLDGPLEPPPPLSVLVDSNHPHRRTGSNGTNSISTMSSSYQQSPTHQNGNIKRYSQPKNKSPYYSREALSRSSLGTSPSLLSFDLPSSVTQPQNLHSPGVPVPKSPVQSKDTTRLPSCPDLPAGCGPATRDVNSKEKSLPPLPPDATGEEAADPFPQARVATPRIPARATSSDVISYSPPLTVSPIDSSSLPLARYETGIQFQSTTNPENSDGNHFAKKDISSLDPSSPQWPLDSSHVDINRNEQDNFSIRRARRASTNQNLKHISKAFDFFKRASKISPAAQTQPNTLEENSGYRDDRSKTVDGSTTRKNSNSHEERRKSRRERSWTSPVFDDLSITKGNGVKV